MTLAVDSLRSDLEALVGHSPLLLDASDLGAFSVDGKTPDCAVAPCTAEQAAAVLHYAGEHHLALIPRGNGTKLADGESPPAV